jgi:hypothetical protein
LKSLSRNYWNQNMWDSKRNHIMWAEKKPLLPTTKEITIRSAVPSDIQDIMQYSQRMKFMSKANEIREELQDDTLNMEPYRLACLKAMRPDEGVVLVAENCDGFRGFIFGMKLEYIWSFGTKILEEVAYLADTPRITYKLIQEYLSRAQDMKDKGLVKMITMGDMVGISPDYSKFGLRLIERKWAK